MTLCPKQCNLGSLIKRLHESLWSFFFPDSRESPLCTMCTHHSAASLAAMVTSWSGISAAVSSSCELDVLTVALTVARPCTAPCWMFVRMSVVAPEVMMLSEEAVSMLVTTAPPLPFFWCVFMCLARWSLRMKRFEHSGHTNFFSPATEAKGMIYTNNVQ